MSIQYQAKDGSYRTAQNLAALRLLIGQGAIHANTLVYDVLRGDWMPAANHPVCGKFFAEGAFPTPPPGAVPSASEGPPPPAPLPPRARPLAPPPPETHWGKVLWRLIAIPACFLLLCGSLWLAMTPSPSGLGVYARAAGTAVALGSLALACAAGLLTQVWRSSRSLSAAGLALVPGLLLVGAVLFLARPSPHAAAPEAASATATTPEAPRKPLATQVLPDTEGSAATPGATSPEGELRACFAQFFDEVDKAQHTFDAAVKRENLLYALQSASVRDEASIKRARDKLQYASTLVDAYYKKILFLYDDLQSKVQSTSVNPAAKMEVMEAFMAARKTTIPEMKEYCELVKGIFGEAERMLSFMQGFCYSFQNGQRPTMSSADVLTLRLYQERLSSMSDRLDQMEAKSQEDVKRSNDELRSKVERSLPKKE